MESGIFWNIQVPGEGVVFHRAGQVRQDVVGVIGDPSSAYNVPRERGISVFDVEALCEALAP